MLLYRFFIKAMLTGLLLMNSIFSRAQESNMMEEMQELRTDFETLVIHYPLEKMYLHFDKPGYVTGDTIWFKVYLMNEARLRGSLLSGLMYIELSNEENKVVKRMALPVVAGLSWGDIPLDTTFNPGNYTLHTYTNWMLNFGYDHLFTRQIKIAGNPHEAWTAQMALEDKGDQAKIHLHLRGMQQQPLSGKRLQISLMNDKRRLHTNALTTDQNGELEFNFSPPEGKLNNLSLSISESDKANPRMVIPLLLNRPQDIDLQFMPEGGNMIANQLVRLGFKAIGEDGKGVPVSGTITNSQGAIVAGFQALHRGMGSCLLLPEDGETYTAHITRPAGCRRTYPLPPVKRSGTLLQVHHMLGTHSLLIQIAASPDIAGQSFLLTGQADGRLLYETNVKIPAQGIALKVSTSVFPHGVVKFSLLDKEKHPLNERRVFIDHPDELQVEVQANKKQYLPHDSIALRIHVVDKEGKPVSGSFSMAVTDDSQVKAGSAHAGNILDYFYLSSYLHGHIEDPGYYLHRDSFPVAAMDNLLLTQGWTGYDWPMILNASVPPPYQPEPYFAVKGKVMNAFKKPLAGTRVLLVSGRPGFMKDTITDENGSFTFTGFPPMDTAVFSIQAWNRKGKPYNAGIVLDEFKAPRLPPDTFPETLPWNVNTDHTLLQYATDNALHRQEQEKIVMKGHRLNELVVTASKIVRGSYNLNGPGGADLIIDEDELVKAGRVSVFDLLTSRISKLEVNYIDIIMSHYQKLKGFYFSGRKTSIIIDGNKLAISYPSFEEQMDKLKAMDAQDIKGIEVMYSSEYTNKYDARFIGTVNQMKPYVYIEITSRSGNVLFNHQAPGAYTYRPLPFSWPKKFYRPVYPLKNDSVPHTDLRSTIHWDPDVETDSSGNAIVSFYAADKPATYTMIIQGSDMKGHLGYEKLQIKVRGGE